MWLQNEASSAGQESQAETAGTFDQAIELSEESLGAAERWIERVLPFYADYAWLQVLTLVGLSVLAASLVSWFLKRVVARWLAKTATDFDDQLLSALTPPIYTSVICMGLRVALLRLDLSEPVTRGFGHSLGTLVVLVWLLASFRMARLLITTLANREDRFSTVTPTTAPLFDNLTKVTLVVVAAYIILDIWDKNLSGLLAAGGLIGLAVGFAARDTLANLFAGIFIFADAPYKIGDFINLDTGERGMVTDIGLRSTRLLTRDDVQVTIPNAAMGAAKIVNESGGPHLKYRVRVKVGVAYGSDIDHVRQVLMDIAVSHPLVCEEPEPRVRFRVFGESSLDLELLCWIDEPVLRGRVLDALNTEIYKGFAREGIEIPYAKRDVFIKEMPESPG